MRARADGYRQVYAGVLGLLDQMYALMGDEKISLQDLTQQINERFEAIKDVIKHIDILLDSYRITPYVYEEFLCYTMQGICFIKFNDYPSAMNSFLNSLKSATESHMTNIERNALFNIMQLNLLCGNESTADIYAQRANDILKKAFEQNPICKSSLENMLQSVTDRLNCFLFDDVDIPCYESKMLAVAYDKYLFVIKN